MPIPMGKTNRHSKMSQVDQDLAHWRSNTHRNVPTCFVYLISDGGAVKIGVATDPKDRLKALQCGNPRPLELIFVLPGSHDLEAHLHRRYKRNRVQGEWFFGIEDTDLIEYVAKIRQRMLDAHLPGRPAPHYLDDGVRIKPKPKARRRKWRMSTGEEPEPVKVRFVEPQPRKRPTEPYDPRAHPIAAIAVTPSTQIPYKSHGSRTFT